MQKIALDAFGNDAFARRIEINNTQYYSAGDVLQHVYKIPVAHIWGKWTLLPQSFRDEMASSRPINPFPGDKEGKLSLMLPFPDIMEMISRIPCADKDAHYTAMRSILAKHEKNQESPQSEACPPPESQDQSVALLKRKRDELELANLTFDYQARCQNHTLDFHARCQQMYKDATDDKKMNERARMIFSEGYLNMAMLNARGPQQPVDTGAGFVMNTPISIAMVASDLKIKLGPKDDMQVGRIVKDLYVAKYGEEPNKHTQLCGGKSVGVNSYYEEHRPLLEEALRELEARRNASSKKYKTLKAFYAGRA